VSDDIPTITIEELMRGGRPMTVMERLEQHALGNLEMSNTEIQAAKLFLDKTIPTLKATELTGKNGGPLEIRAKLTFVDPAE
jgi:hypothetical protein